jgi:hypothetical protein
MRRTEAAIRSATALTAIGKRCDLVSATKCGAEGAAAAGDALGTSGSRVGSSKLSRSLIGPRRGQRWVCRM